MRPEDYYLVVIMHDNGEWVLSCGRCKRIVSRHPTPAHAENARLQHRHRVAPWRR